MESTLLLLSSSNFAGLDISVQKEVYHEFYKLVYPAIMFMVRDHGTAEDIIQDTFLKAIKDIPEVESFTQLRGWIKVVVRNTTYNYLRKNKRKRNDLDFVSVFNDKGLDLVTNAESIESEVELKAVSESIVNYMLDLKPEYRSLIEMRWKQDKSYKEIATDLGLKEETVKSKLHRAREAIKKRFLKEWGEK
jgi:RNA polymerase sigma-70 factor, ECF subfamily